MKGSVGGGVKVQGLSAGQRVISVEYRIWPFVRELQDRHSMNSRDEDEVRKDTGEELTGWSEDEKLEVSDRS